MSLRDLDLGRARILLLRQGGLGDALVCVPVARALRQALPHARIDLLLSRRNYVVAPAYRPYVNTIWNYTKRPWQTLRLLAALGRQHYDLAIDLIDGPSTTSRLLLRASRARYRLGIGRRPESVYTDAAPSLFRPDLHIVERLSQVPQPLGIDPAAVPLTLEFPIDPADRDTAHVVLGPRQGECRIGINLSGGFAAKYWGRDKFIALVRHIRTQHRQAEVLIFGAPDYADEVSAIAAATGARPVPPASAFGLFAALLNACDVIVTPDTSVSHLAAAWQKPAVVLFIQSQSHSATLWAPYHSPHRALWHSDRVADIPVDQVIAALDDLMQQHAVPCH